MRIQTVIGKFLKWREKKSEYKVLARFLEKVVKFLHKKVKFSKY